MNAIDKLKSDLERYHKALTQIRCDYTSSSIAHQTAEAALNPPPVTLPELLSALDGWKERNNEYIAILFNPDESGNLRRGFLEEEIFEFTTLRQALDFLNKL